MISPQKQLNIQPEDYLPIDPEKNTEGAEETEDSNAQEQKILFFKALGMLELEVENALKDEKITLKKLGKLIEQVAIFKKNSKRFGGTEYTDKWEFSLLEKYFQEEQKIMEKEKQNTPISQFYYLKEIMESDDLTKIDLGKLDEIQEKIEALIKDKTVSLNSIM